MQMTEQQFDNIEDYIADLKAKLAVNRECGNTLYNLGVAYLSKRDFMEAERCFREAVANSPKLAEAYVQLGGIAMQRGDLKTCLTYNVQATQQRPFFAVPWGNIGFCQLQLGEADKAIQSLKRAIKYDNKFVQALATLGSAYFTVGDLEESAKALEAAVSIEPLFGPAWNNLALVSAEKGDWARAKECVAKAQETGYEVPEAFLKEIEENAN
jgi:tetratricopeptide (TPR) repeat protein